MPRAGYKHVARGSGSPLAKARRRRDRVQGEVDALALRVAALDADLIALTAKLAKMRKRLLGSIEELEGCSRNVGAVSADRAKRDARRDIQTFDHLETEPITLLIRRASVHRAAHGDDPNWLDSARPEFQRAYRSRVLGEVTP